MRELERDLPTSSAPRGGRESAVPALAVIGAGRVGNTMHRACSAAGLEVRLAGREDALAACRASEAALLCVPDAEIPAAARAIAEAIPPLRFVGHTSGATRLEALAACSDRGAATFSVHPLQTIPDGSAELTGAPCAIAGRNASAEGLALKLAEALEMRPFAVAEERRAAYHAAASMASNFLVALEESAAGLLAEAGVADARELLAPLVLRTAANWAERGADALTGPIARGDRETIARHTEAIRELAPELLPVYEALAARTAELAAPEERR